MSTVSSSQSRSFIIGSVLLALLIGVYTLADINSTPAELPDSRPVGNFQPGQQLHSFDQGEAGIQRDFRERPVSVDQSRTDQGTSIFTTQIFERSTTITVVDEFDLPISNARIQVEGLDQASRSLRRGPLSDPTYTGQTDSEGRIVFGLSGPGYLQVAEPQAWPMPARAIRRIEPGSNILVRLITANRKVTILDADTGEPIGDSKVTISCSAGAFALGVVTRTDSEGAIYIEPEIGKVMVTLQGRGVVRILGARVDGVASELIKAMSVQLPEIGDTVLRVELDRIMFYFTDALSGEPLNGKLTMTQERNSLRDGVASWWRVASFTEEIPCLNGLAYADSRFVRPRVGMRVKFELDQYCHSTLASNSLQRGQELNLVPLVRSSGSVEITVLNQGGAAFTGPVVALDGDSNSTLFLGNTTVSGVFVIKDWCGSRLTLKAGPSGELSGKLIVGNSGIDRFTVVLDGAQSKGVLVVRHPPPLGVDLCNQNAVIAICETGVAYQPTEWVDGRTTFAGLPVGRYIVGPPIWVKSLVEQGVLFSPSQRPEHLDRDVIVQVASGSMTVVEWGRDWLTTQDISGRVTLPRGYPASVVLLPVYGVTASDLGIQSGARYRVHSDGGYLIPRGAPRPAALVVFSQSTDSRGGGGVALAVIQPGESLSVPLEEFRVSAIGSKALLRVKVMASATPNPMSGRYSLTDAGIYSWSWNPQHGPLRGFVTPGLSEFIVSYSRGSEQYYRTNLTLTRGTDGLLEATLNLDDL